MPMTVYRKQKRVEWVRGGCKQSNGCVMSAELALDNTGMGLLKSQYGLYFTQLYYVDLFGIVQISQGMDNINTWLYFAYWCYISHSVPVDCSNTGWLSKNELHSFCEIWWI